MRTATLLGRFSALLLLAGFTSSGAGYEAIDSDEATGPLLAWDDPSGGTALTLSDTDDGAVEVALPFSFTFMGSTHTAASVCTNGFIQFGGSNTAYDNGTSFPATGGPNNIIAVFWDDLVGDPTSSIRTQLLGTAPDRRFVISWVAFRRYGTAPGGMNLTFQAALFEQGGIRIQYQTMDTGPYAAGVSATVGIENGTGSDGIAYLVNGAPTGNATAGGLAVGFLPVGATVPWPVRSAGGGGGGGGGVRASGGGRNNDNGDFGINDRFCAGGAVSAAGGLLGLALAFSVFAAALLPRK